MCKGKMVPTCAGEYAGFLYFWIFRLPLPQVGTIYAVIQLECNIKTFKLLPIPCKPKKRWTPLFPHNSKVGSI